MLPTLSWWGKLSVMIPQRADILPRTIATSDPKSLRKGIFLHSEQMVSHSFILNIVFSLWKPKASSSVWFPYLSGNDALFLVFILWIALILFLKYFGNIGTNKNLIIFSRSNFLFLLLNYLFRFLVSGNIRRILRNRMLRFREQESI